MPLTPIFEVILQPVAEIALQLAGYITACVVVPVFTLGLVAVEPGPKGLWAELSPSELAYVSAERPTSKQRIDASWKSEGLIVLLWALEKVERLPAPNEQCDTSVFQQHLPPFVQVTASEYISAATHRPHEVLVEMADEPLHLGLGFGRVHQCGWQRTHRRARRSGRGCGTGSMLKSARIVGR